MNKMHKNNKGGRTQTDRLFLFNSFLYFTNNTNNKYNKHLPLISPIHI
uniref:Uncharacterized protein n=1 Tax=Myoviridae sp. ctFPV8 TaxID=2825068 RepID=A0A8S5PBG0_9CAUD|nr:MAG TPA: hypothetical protein [Myoviridae sp. ctFPV8]